MHIQSDCVFVVYPGCACSSRTAAGRSALSSSSLCSRAMSSAPTARCGWGGHACCGALKYWSGSLERGEGSCRLRFWRISTHKSSSLSIFVSSWYVCSPGAHLNKCPFHIVTTTFTTSWLFSPANGATVFTCKAILRCTLHVPREFPCSRSQISNSKENRHENIQIQAEGMLTSSYFQC